MAEVQSGRIAVRCSCGAKLAAPVAAAGRSIKCPKCHNSLPIPAPSSAASDTVALSSPARAEVAASGATTSGRIGVRCSSCGVRMKVAATAVGHKGRCPKCGQPFVVPDPAATQLEPAATSATAGTVKRREPAEESDTNSLIDDLAREEQAARVITEAQGPAAGPQRPCPSCGAMMAADAILCVSCGYNTQTGRMQKVAGGGSGLLSALTQVDGLGILSRAAHAAGPLVVGTVLCAVGAAVGGAFWSVIAIKTGYEVGWIAWIVGVLAGIGMHIGFRDESPVAGGIAAGMSVLSIVAAKAVIFVFLIAAILGRLGGDDSGGGPGAGKSAKASTAFSSEIDRIRMASQRAERLAMQKGLAPGGDDWMKLYEQEKTKCKAMSTADVERAIKGLEAWEKGGKWSDAEYVRNYLTYAYANEAIRGQTSKDTTGNSGDAGDEDEEDEETPIAPGEWKKIHGAAVAKVEAIPAEERAGKARAMEAEREERIKQAIAKAQEGSGAGGRVGGTAGFFFKAMFNPIDIVFFGLAIITAYRIGGKGVTVGQT